MGLAEDIVKRANARGRRGPTRTADDLKITVRVDAELQGEARAAARDDGETVAEYVRVLIYRDLQRRRG